MIAQRLRRFATPLLLVALWQAGSSSGLIPARTIAAPSAIALALEDLLVSGQLVHHLAVSLRRVATGLAIAIAIGTTLALVAGLSRRGEDAVDATMQMLRTLPFLALVPLFILWFGIGETPKIALVALGATFPIYLTAGRIFGLGRGGLIRHIILPGALPSALVGLRYALGVAWLSLVVAEQINADSGIGYLIMDARDFLRTDVIIVGLLVYSLLGLTADGIVRAIERHALAWRPSFLRS